MEFLKGWSCFSPVGLAAGGQSPCRVLIMQAGPGLRSRIPDLPKKQQITRECRAGDIPPMRGGITSGHERISGFNQRNALACHQRVRGMFHGSIALCGPERQLSFLGHAVHIPCQDAGDRWRSSGLVGFSWGCPTRSEFISRRGHSLSRRAGSCALARTYRLQ